MKKTAVDRVIEELENEKATIQKVIDKLRATQGRTTRIPRVKVVGRLPEAGQ
jgi:predicted transcriptional regulator